MGCGLGGENIVAGFVFGAGFWFAVGARVLGKVEIAVLGVLTGSAAIAYVAIESINTIGGNLIEVSIKQEIGRASCRERVF